MKKLFVISNENIFNCDGNFFCDNIDMKSTPEGLQNKFQVNIVARYSKKERSYKINLKNINICKSFISFIFKIIKACRENESKYLIISLTPFTFFACILIKILNKRPILYLRSDGYKEYKAIFGFLGEFVYHFMFSIISKISNLVSCNKYILRGKKGNIVTPSQLNKNWFLNIKEPNLEDIKILYVGRIKIEKGIFSLLKIIKNIKNIKLTIVGAEKNIDKIIQNNVEIHEIETNEKALINYYDNHNIFILPSFTEGHPMVLLEALSRLRPVIVFNEIEHIIGDKKGIFVASRNSKSLEEKISHIKNNYTNIQNEMKKNNLPTNINFLNQLSNIIIND